MSARIAQLVFDAQGPARLARFWADALAWRIIVEEPDEVEIEGGSDDINLLFGAAEAPKTSKNVIHLDLVAESVEHQDEIVDRLITLGARHIDIGQGAEADHVVLADPEGNELCIVLRGEFLADTGFMGAVVFEPANPATGYFWAEAIGWPVVYDQDGDVAIRVPGGRGPFITFGPPGVAKNGKNRVHLDVAPHADGNQAAEVDRLLALGAKRIDIGQRDVPWVVLADPDGNELCVLTPR
jgi:hypothetical protein